jgi:hypothetical protein
VRTNDYCMADFFPERFRWARETTAGLKGEIPLRFVESVSMKNWANSKALAQKTHEKRSRNSYKRARNLTGVPVNRRTQLENESLVARFQNPRLAASISPQFGSKLTTSIVLWRRRTKSCIKSFGHRVSNEPFSTHLIILLC